MSQGHYVARIFQPTSLQPKHKGPIANVQETRCQDGVWGHSCGCGDALAVIISSAQTSDAKAMIRRGQHGRHRLQV